MPMHRRLAALTLALLVPATALGAPAAAQGKRAAGFPYWPKTARPGHAVPLKDGAAFRAALGHVVRAAKEAGWTRIAWDQARDGGLTLRYGRPEPDHTEVTVHLAWHAATARGALTYQVGRRAPPRLFHGFPLCPRRDLVGSVATTGTGRFARAVAHCRSGGFVRSGGHELTRGESATHFPELYGWKDLGRFGVGYLFSRDGVFVEASTRDAKKADQIRNRVRFDGHEDPRGTP